ncbi:MAG: hypothetical protein J6U54_13400 [Clostridiales bacterium]|nr:hypothetical protein [Clostridiales bacterium]
MAIDTIIMLETTGVIGLLIFIILLAMNNLEMKQYEKLLECMEDIQRKEEELLNNVRYLKELANGSCKPVDFQSYYPTDWSDAWEILDQQAEDQALGETGD